MSMSNAAETAWLTLLLNNTNWANIGDATGLRGSTVAGSFYIALHTADPGEAGDQTTSEATYTGYARVAVARSGAGWTISGANGSNAAAITFGACTVGSNTITYASLGVAPSGASQIISSGVLGGSGSLAVTVGITPNIPIGDFDVNAD
jgi:hypothetical protein